VSGLELVPARGPLIVVANHDSQWDPVVVALALRGRRELRFLARGNLFRIPGLGPVLRAAGQIRFPRRPRVAVSFFEPAEGQHDRDGGPGELAARLLEQIRLQAPAVPAGRRTTTTAPGRTRGRRRR